MVQQTPLRACSCTPMFRSKFKIHSAHADSLNSKLPSILCNFDVGPVFASQGENFIGATDSLMLVRSCTLLNFFIFGKIALGDFNGFKTVTTKL